MFIAGKSNELNNPNVILPILWMRGHGTEYE